MSKTNEGNPASSTSLHKVVIRPANGNYSLYITDEQNNVEVNRIFAPKELNTLMIASLFAGMAWLQFDILRMPPALSIVVVSEVTFYFKGDIVL